MPPDRLVFLLKRAQVRVSDLAEPGLAALGVDGREFAVLSVFAAAPEPLSQRDAAALLMIDRTTMVALVDGLERRGLVERRGHPADRRKNTLVLTAEGTAVLERADAVAAEAEAQFLAPLGPDRADEFRSALQLLRPY
ncbi:MarR family winged helix-turn-helix transcriptional regulator [Pseudonocardia xinjiangensis]|uniref:MarR family winged helix-turn-helix transcriptional regulator n=1 Tax=Pseudonocardia xinjiangensis TaxID=75289 RepID=UPI003D8E2D97